MADHKGMQGYRVKGVIVDEVFGGKKTPIKKLKFNWDGYGTCPSCRVEAKKPCRRYRWGTYKRRVDGQIKSKIYYGTQLKAPHRSRKSVAMIARPLGTRITW